MPVTSEEAKAQREQGPAESSGGDPEVSDLKLGGLGPGGGELAQHPTPSPLCAGELLLPWLGQRSQAFPGDRKWGPVTDL